MPNPASADFSAVVQQSAVDKLLDSVRYPFTALEARNPFPGCGRMGLEPDEPGRALTRDEITAMLSSAVRGAGKTADDSVEDQVYSYFGGLIEQAKRVLEASEQNPDEYEGPDPEEMRAIVDGGIEGLPKALGDWGMYVWCPSLRVTVKTRPQFLLNSPRIDLDKVRIEVVATGELWAKHPWWNCYKWCFKWKKVIKCNRVASLTVSPDIAADAHATVRGQGAKVYAAGEFDRLRLDYPILREIPLEGLANRTLEKKLVYVYDASKLIASVPVLESQFSVESIALPATTGGIRVDVTVRES